MSGAAAPMPYRFTREEYYRMGEVGLFDDKRVELLDGEIIAMAPQNPPHAGTTNYLASIVMHLLGPTVSVRIQAPIVLNDWSEPEPDIAVCRLDPDNYRRRHPEASEVLLLIEVADTSLAYDRGRKVVAYASSSIAEYWIVNLTDDCVEVLSDPDPTARRYHQERRAFAGDILLLPGGTALSVADILPRP